MKKFTKALLCAAIAATMAVPTALTASAAELTVVDGSYGNITSTGGCGFLDGNLYVSEGFTADSLNDLTVTVNGKTAYFNNGYLGVKHCGLKTDYGDGKPANGWLQVGIVGADLVAGENTLVITDKAGNTVTRTITSSTNTLGYTYSEVASDAETKTLKAEIIFNADPGFAIDTTFEGRCHDDHGNTNGTFRVTAYDADTKMYTIEATDYVPGQSLLELKVTSDGAYKDYWISTTINSKNTLNASGLTDANTTAVTTGATKQTLTNLASTFASDKLGSLTNGVGDGTGKWEGGFPGEGITLTFETESAVKASYLVLYTGNDDKDWNNRAPGAFKLYGSTNGTDYVEIKNVAASGMKGNANYAPTAFKLPATTEYKYYKLVITSTLGAGYFQMGELELYTGDVTLPDALPVDGYSVVAAGVAYNGTHPQAEQPDQPDQPTDSEKPAPTGDALTVLIAVSAIAMVATAVVVSKKRNAAY
ncbi:MAG: discoidin domain-containing protein [Eubacteriales bacterium]